MILGTGIDIIQIPRIEALMARFGERFTVRIFTAAEQAKALSAPSPQHVASHFAKRFAAKEACVKALPDASGVSWQDIEIGNHPNGKPFLILHGKALSQLQQNTPDGLQARLHLSLSDDYPIAQAMVWIEAIA